MSTHQIFLDEISALNVSIDETAVEARLEQCREKRKQLMQTEDKLDEVRKVAGQLALHNGEFSLFLGIGQE